MPDWTPETWLIAAGRTRVEGDPLNVPPVFASNFFLPDERVYSRAEQTPTVDALETVIGGEQPADRAEPNHERCGGNGAKDQVHDRSLHQDRINGVHTGQDQSGHGTRKEYQADCLGRLDLRSQRGSHRRTDVGEPGLA